MNKRPLCLLVPALVLATLAGCASHKTDYPKLSDQSLAQAMEAAQDAQEADSKGKFDEAVKLGHRAVALRPDIGSLWNNLGLYLMHRGQPNDFVDAAQAFKKAADMLPTDDRPYQNLGVLYHDRGFSEDALSYFNHALERNPNSLESLRGAIAATKLLNKSDEAGLTRISRALLLETDPTWRQVMEFERMRIEQELVERSKPAPGTS
jgi:tetratricopeptide (TPR) repeat protein